MSDDSITSDDSSVEELPLSGDDDTDSSCSFEPIPKSRDDATAKRTPVKTKTTSGTTPVKRTMDAKVVLERIEGCNSPIRIKRISNSFPTTSTSTPLTPPLASPNSSFHSPGEIKSGVTCRSSQYKLLKAIFGSSAKHKLPGALFLWGASAAGKCYTLEKVLEEPDNDDILKVKIHCSEILCGRRAFFETFVKQLISQKGLPMAPNFKCDSLRSLYTNIFDFCEQLKGKYRIVAVIQGIEALKGEDDDILQFLCRLRDAVKGNLCVAFLSSLPPTHFMPTIMEHTIVPIHFPQYTSDELVEILKEAKIVRRRTNKSASFYEFYVKMIVSMFYPVCRDIRKLGRLVKSHWEKFETMVEESKDVLVTKLWKTLEPQLKTQFFEMNSTLVNSEMNDKNQENLGKFQNLPLNAKYLVIASYIATHNPPTSDKRFFVKSGAPKAKKSKKTVISKTDANSSKPFLRTFELNRLTAIFSAIQENYNDKAVNKNRSVGFMNLITTLCQNKLIQHVGEDSSGNVKYKCLLDYDAIMDVSRSVGFELNNYLYHLL